MCVVLCYVICVCMYCVVCYVMCVLCGMLCMCVLCGMLCVYMCMCVLCGMLCVYYPDLDYPHPRLSGQLGNPCPNPKRVWLEQDDLPTCASRHFCVFRTT